MSKRSVGVNNGNWQGGKYRDKGARQADLAEAHYEKEIQERKYLIEQEWAWMEKCAEVEGKASFCAWYESDEVPSENIRTRIEMLQARYAGLKITHADEFYWLEVEKQEVKNCVEIEGREGFQEWWNDDKNFPSTTPKERVEMIRARIAAFLANDGTTQVQARVRALQQAIITSKAINRSEITKELAELGNHLQRVGIPLSGDEGVI